MDGDWRNFDALGETRPLTAPAQVTPGASKATWFDFPPELRDHPRYELVEFLGAGGMGVVYKAQHRYMDRPVALKVVNQALLERPQMLARFHREVRAAARLTHPNIVHAYDAEEWHNTHFLVMEYVEGSDLDRILAAEKQLSVPLASRYIRQAALGLAHAHERGMIHRDIKPHNLMVNSGGQIKILDFGLARMIGDLEWPPVAATGTLSQTRALQLTNSDTHLGTADYLAPEVIHNPQSADIRSDIYSLGCTLYRLLTGKVPCPADSLEDKLQCQLDTNLPTHEDLPENLPLELLELLERMMAKNPQQRFQTPRDVADALVPFEGSSVRRVLIVDDDTTIRQAMSRVLNEQGYRILTAAHGQEALEVLRAGPRIDLILLDLVMPVMDGWEFLQARSQDPSIAGIPVVIVSSNEAIEAQAAACGAADCLHKPVHIDELVTRIELARA